MINNNASVQISSSSSNRTSFSLIPKLSVLLLIFFVVGCGIGGDEDESGTIGTGIMLDGRVNDTLLATNAVIDAFSSDGRQEVITINDDRSFSTAALNGKAPWLLRVQIDTATALYGIAYSDGTRNINSFSDAAVRRSLAQRSTDPESVISSDDRAGLLPSSLDYDEAVGGITDLISLVMDSYGVISTDLISTNYVNDDTGVDAFLKSNMAVVENDLLSFQVTDPDTNLKAETRSSVSIADSFVDSGNGPSQPGLLRVLNGGLNDLVLVWEPSLDDVAVAGYTVLRDGDLIGTTPYPQFIDTDLDNNQSYNYIVIALDRAGNSSPPSTTGTGTTSQPAPAIGPIPPTMLAEVSSSNRFIRLAWNAPLGTAVASYNLYRGALTTTPSLLQQVSDVTALDTAVAAGLTYCYAVAAVDAAGRESSRSETVCIDAEESLLDESTLTLSDWNVPSTDINCSDSLTVADLPVGRTTLTSGCYVVPQSIVVPAAATLQIDEGVILKFAEAAKISVIGTLTVLGTPENPVVFTGQTNEPGAWGGIEFTGTETANNVLRGAVVQYGGSGEVVAAVSTRFSNNRFLMEDTLVRFTAGPAIGFNNGGTNITSFERNLIYANDATGFVIASAMHVFSSTSRFVDNAENQLSVMGIRFTGDDIVIPDVGSPIEWNGLTLENGSLTIMPGADIFMGVGSIIDVDGPVIINGEPERPITLTGRSDTFLGSWEGIRLRGPGNKVINYLDLSHGGFTGGNRGAVEIDCSEDNSVSVKIANTKIADSAGWGIYLKSGGCDIDIADTVTYSNNVAGNSNVP